MKLSEIVATVGELKTKVGELFSDKLKATEAVLADFSKRITQCESDISAANAENIKIIGERDALTQTKKTLDADFAAANLIVSNFNKQLTDACLNGKLFAELKGEDGKPLAEDAAADVRLKAALAVPLETKFSLFQGGVNATLAKLNLPSMSMPSTPASAPLGAGNAKLITRAEFEGLSHEARNEFFRKGGKLKAEVE